MKKVLYISTIEVPYRVRFFNEFARCCDLTVVYSRTKPTSRDGKWTSSEKENHKVVRLRGIKLGKEDSFSIGAVKYAFDKSYDSVILGCYNSPIQMLTIILMRLFKRPYILNLDGEVFSEGRGLKNKIKRFFLRGAQKYIAAGEKSMENLRSVVGDKPIIPYYFSSMSAQELKKNAQAQCSCSGKVLVVGQYLDVKGLDVALEAAKMDDSISYKFIGMGATTQNFIDKYKADSVKNVEIVPFLQKADLENEYRNCALFVLPSRQECWGLVINEAASFGTPIVSTWGSGAAVEFLADSYPQYLAKPGDSADLYNRIVNALKSEDIHEYSRYLISKSSMYSIERGVEAHCEELKQ